MTGTLDAVLVVSGTVVVAAAVSGVGIVDGDSPATPLTLVQATSSQSAKPARQPPFLSQAIAETDLTTTANLLRGWK